MSVLQRAQAKLRATAQDSRDLELADTVDELHTELWFWQSAIHHVSKALAGLLEERQLVRSGKAIQYTLPEQPRESIKPYRG